MSAVLWRGVFQVRAYSCGPVSQKWQQFCARFRVGFDHSGALRLRQTGGQLLGADPLRGFSAGKQRLGHLTKQGHTLLRYLLVEAAQTAARCDPLWHRRFVHLSMRRNRGIAKAALARKLAVSLYWLWRNSRQQATAADLGSHVG